MCVFKKGLEEDSCLVIQSEVEGELPSGVLQKERLRVDFRRFWSPTTSRSQKRVSRGRWRGSGRPC